MIDVWLELSQENPRLAVAEAVGAAEAIGGADGGDRPSFPGAFGRWMSLPGEEAVRPLVGRLAFGYRCVRPRVDGPARQVTSWLESTAIPGESAAFRPVGHPTSAGSVDPFARAWVDGGGRIELRSPARRFWFANESEDRWWLGEELGRVDRGATTGRRMPTLPFQKPVSLPPRLGRAAANLARIRAGQRVIDPFVGTGALLLEAALLGARVSGGDADAQMVRGTAANFEHLNLPIVSLKVADAGEPFPPGDAPLWDAIVTDPPYGRSSGTFGESPSALLPRALARWADLVRPGGWLSVVAPSSAPTELGPGWVAVDSVPDRVHRSLTREFRTYRRRD